jgi:transcriptional regulator with XRE-family HTH domain
MTWQSSATIPHEVVVLMLEDGGTPTRAWRTFLNLSVSQMAERLGITEVAFELLDAAPTLSSPILERVAAALGILPEQLDV